MLYAAAIENTFDCERVRSAGCCRRVAFKGVEQEQVNVTDEQLKEMLNREVPEGTSKASVRQFLHRKGWPHADDGSNIRTMIRDAAHSLLVRTDIQIVFLFAPQGKLISYEIKDYFSGP